MIHFEDVWEMYKIRFSAGGKQVWDTFWALKGVSFSAAKGECVGVVGENGAGKSTLLKLIAGILTPDRGRVKLGGRASGLLEAGAGFKDELTGMENVYLQGSMYGLSGKDIDREKERIVSFADIGKFINAPLKTYSQGMYVRLAFAVAVHINPEILVIDDYLAVGDQFFQKKCFQKIYDLKDGGKTIIIVSHDMALVRRLCPRILYLKEGRIIKDGAAGKVISFYSQTAGKKEGIRVLEQGLLRAVFNNGRLHVSVNGHEITSTSGGWVLMRIGQRWYSSPEADWEVEAADNGLVRALGSYHTTGISQEWCFKVTEGNSIHWDVAIRAPRGITVDECAAELMASEEYVRWQTPFERGVFLGETAHTQRESGYLSAAAAAPALALFPKEGNSLIPCVLALEGECAEYTSKIVTDIVSCARVLRFSFPFKGVSGKGDTSDASFHISFSCAEAVERKFAQVQEQSSLGRGPLSLFFYNGAVSVCRLGRMITKAEHMKMAVHANNCWYTSHTACWKVSKEDESTLIGEGKWRELPGLLRWKMHLSTDDCFTWEIFFETDRGMMLYAECVRILLSEEYDFFSTYLGKEMFPREFGLYEFDILQRCIGPGAVTFMSSSKSVSPLRLSFGGSEGVIAKVFNSDVSGRARVLQIERAQPEADTVLTKKEVHHVRIKGEFIETGNEEKNYEKIHAGRHTFVFGKGEGKILDGAQELTKHMGVYSSIKRNGRWHDSRNHASWLVRKEQKNVFCRGIWHEFSARQEWRISPVAQGIGIEVVLVLEEPADIGEHQFNIMLSEQYVRWDTGGEKGIFPRFRDDVGDSWQVVCEQGPNGRNSLYVKAVSDIPASFIPVALCVEGEDHAGVLRVSNTGLHFRARVLQYTHTFKSPLGEGKYPLFQGKVIPGETL